MDPKEFLLYYTAVFFVAALIIMRKRPRRGMLLKLRGRGAGKAAGGRSHGENEPRLGGAQPPSNVTNLHGERPLNVIFNYNGESWDAYEVLGLPAGSSLERAEQVYAESLQRVDEGARPFMEAAFAAIKTQWDSYKIPKGS
jgi:hypothetical protein